MQPRPAYGQPAYGQPGPYGQAPSGPGWRQPPPPGQGYGGYGGYGQGGYGQGPGGPGQPSGRPAGSDGPGGPADRRRRGSGFVVGAVLLGLILALGAGYAGGRIGDRDAASSNPSALANSSSTSASIPPITQMTGTAEQAVEEVAREALPSVVSLTVVSGQTGDSGSGIILSSDGLILTNNHVISAAATSGSITVSFNDGTSAKGTIVGRDPVTDLAVVKAAGKSGLKPATLGDSSSIEVGEQVVAVGSPLGLNGTVTTGIISALNRPVAASSDDSADTSASPNVINALQTDAPINPGNSGGPLYNLSGQVIGINSAIAALPSSDSTSQSGSIGLGFAIPINQITPIVAELEKTGKATHAELGVQISTQGNAATGLTTGAIVETVESGSAAQKAGLQKGDVVTEVEGRQIIDADSLVATIRSQRPGDKVSVTFTRAGKSQTVTVTLGSDG
jgi:putative serine protease PepD